MNSQLHKANNKVLVLDDESDSCHSEIFVKPFIMYGIDVLNNTIMAFSPTGFT